MKIISKVTSYWHIFQFYLSVHELVMHLKYGNNIQKASIIPHILDRFSYHFMCYFNKEVIEVRFISLNVEVIMTSDYVCGIFIFVGMTCPHIINTPPVGSLCLPFERRETYCFSLIFSSASSASASSASVSSSSTTSSHRSLSGP